VDTDHYAFLSLVPDEVCDFHHPLTFFIPRKVSQYPLDMRMKEKESELSLDVMGEKECLPLPEFYYFIGQTTLAALF
jgi:hypothetical protein